MQVKVEQFDTPPPNYSTQQHATNGFSHRPSLAQLASYLVISFTIAVYFSCTHSLHPSTPLLILFSLCGLLLILSTALATFTNPTDRVVYYYKWSRHDRKITFSPEYDKVLYCEFCDSYCRSSSKHCRACNRCVNTFDHHCMWFNNCVGQRNYHYFFTSIITTFLFAVVVITHVLLASLNTDYSQPDAWIKAALGWVAALLMAVFGFLLFNLIALHCYLLATKQTTYQFLQRRKKEEEEEKKLKEQREKVNASESQPNNKVMPTSYSPHKNGHHQLHSEQSMANAKVVMIQGKSEEGDDVRTDQEHKKSEMKLKEQLRIEIEKQQKDLIFNEVQSELSKAYEKDEYPMQKQVRLSESYDSLPRFLRQNKSLKLMLPSEMANSPSKSKMQLSLDISK